MISDTRIILIFNLHSTLIKYKVTEFRGMEVEEI